MPALGTSHTLSPKAQEFARGIAHLRRAFGDAGMDKEDLEQLTDMINFSKYRRFSPLFTEIAKRIITDGKFKLPTLITEATADELGLK